MVHGTLTLTLALGAAAGAAVGRAQFEKPISVIFDGWTKRADGSYELVFGYINRNAQPVDIAIGPDNTVSPGGPDRGQPTVFLPGRQRLLFSIPVGADFKGKYVWALTYAGATQLANASLDQNYSLDVGDEPPPTIALPATLSVGATAQATLQPAITAPLPPPPPQAAPTGARSRAPVNRIVVWWSKYRGPGMVTFGDGAPPVGDEAPGGGRQAPQGTFRVVCPVPLTTTCGATTARFSAPGTYTLRAVAVGRTASSGVMTVTVTP